VHTLQKKTTKIIREYEKHIYRQHAITNILLTITIRIQISESMRKGDIKMYEEFESNLNYISQQNENEVMFIKVKTKGSLANNWSDWSLANN
jgi:hypothetical protein